TANILLFLGLFLLLFFLGLVVCAVVPSLLLCLYVYAGTLLLMLLFWVTLLPPSAAFALCVLCFLLPLLSIYTHVVSVVNSRMLL
ncbi:E5, partial [Macaca fascicularis papillomavirus 4]